MGLFHTGMDLLFFFVGGFCFFLIGISVHLGSWDIGGYKELGIIPISCGTLWWVNRGVCPLHNRKYTQALICLVLPVWANSTHLANFL